MSDRLLQVDDLSVFVGDRRLVDSVSFSLDRRQRLGIIGESGSGKTLTALSIMGLLADGLRATGTVTLDGASVLTMADGDLGAVRGNAASMIFQEPMTALNPVMRIGRQIAEPLTIHRGMAAKEARAQAVELLAEVGIDEPERRARAFPHELSGGQRQRAMIAMALACSPDLVIADEPTTALDVTVQAQVLATLRDEVVANDAALILITHDLPVVASVTDEVIVMRDGAVVEHGPTAEVFGNPRHDYTADLVASVPPMSQTEGAVVRKKERPPRADPIVVMTDVSKRYQLRRVSLLDSPPVVDAVDGVTLHVDRGETFGIVGESGSGKSTLARMMVGLGMPTSGRVEVDGIEVSGATGRASGSMLRPLRHIAQMVFQDPMGSLDPRLRVRDLVAEPLRSLRIDGDHDARVKQLLDAVELPADSLERYPHEFSGGQRQRIAIARALAPNPTLLVADEPVSALDMSVQTVTLALLEALKEQFGLTIVFISHDLSVVHELCDRAIVLQRGRIVEQGPVSEVMLAPTEQYTKDLLAAIPKLDGSFLPSEGRRPGNDTTR